MLENLRLVNGSFAVVFMFNFNYSSFILGCSFREGVGGGGNIKIFDT